MDLYRITIRYFNDEEHDRPIEIIVYASNPPTALQIFVDLAFDTDEPHHKEILDVLHVIFEHTYRDNTFDTDIFLESDNIIPHQTLGPTNYVDRDLFLRDNWNNFKGFLDKYLTRLDDYIILDALRISNQPTITKKARW